MSDLDTCVRFLQQLIQTPSLPGEEEAIAYLVRQEMEQLGYDDAYIDEAGNVVGYIKGRGEAPPVMFNTHLDHVDVGNVDAWPHPPYGGEIHNECVWGRGAVDIKGPLAAQVYGVARLARTNDTPPGDVYVTGVVFEELGGLGARYMKTNFQVPLVVIGEPSSNTLRRGHRGRIELVVHAQGRSVHASAPHRGANPLDVIAHVIRGLHTLPMRTDPDLGPSTVAPTLIRTDQASANVIPGEVWLTLDWRNIPDEQPDDIIRMLEALLAESTVAGTSASVSIPVFPHTCYTGYKMDIPSCMDPFVTRSNDLALTSAIQVLEALWGSMPETGFWKFATDGGNFKGPETTCIGFAPGDETLAHTIDEHIPIVQLADALDGNEALAKHWPLAVEAAS